MTDEAQFTAVKDAVPYASGGLLGLNIRLDFEPLVDLITAGGPVTVILLILSIAVTTVILLKLLQFARLGVGRTRASEAAISDWIAGEPLRALKSLEGRRGPVAQVVAHAIRGLMAGMEEPRVREDVERVALAAISELRAYLRVIEATVQLAPLLGLFGTVLGMISSFRALQAAGAEADPAVLAGGIWVALLTTAVGLAIAIPAAFVHYWFEGRIEREREHIEQAVTSVLTRRLTPPAPAAERVAVVTEAARHEPRSEAQVR